jgi:hypothetical protein
MSSGVNTRLLFGPRQLGAGPQPISPTQRLSGRQLVKVMINGRFKTSIKVSNELESKDLPTHAVKYYAVLCVLEDRKVQRSVITMRGDIWFLNLIV